MNRESSEKIDLFLLQGELVSVWWTTVGYDIRMSIITKGYEHLRKAQ